VEVPSCDLMFSVSFTGVVGGLAAIVLTVAFGLFWLLRKKSTGRRKVKLERAPPQVDESLLSPGPLTPPTITRVSSPRG
jgi:hypothetical protein